MRCPHTDVDHGEASGGHELHLLRVRLSLAQIRMDSASERWPLLREALVGAHDSLCADMCREAKAGSLGGTSL